ncbi:MAG: hypothetical protein NVS3B20_25930 [Polyangiales bacterium]
MPLEAVPNFVVGALKSLLLLDAKEKIVRAMAPADRRALARGLQLGRQKRDAAEVLFTQRYRAEALRLAIQSVEVTATAFANPQVKDLVKPRHRETLHAELRALLDAFEAPALDDEFSAHHGHRFRALLALQNRLALAASPLSRTDLDLTRARRTRQALVAAALLFCMLALGRLGFPPRTLTASASGAYADVYRPERAIDGNSETEWLLPDKTEGTLDLAVSPRGSIGSIRLLNARNSPHFDRATRDFRIEVYRKKSLVKTVDGTVPA